MVKIFESDLKIINKMYYLDYKSIKDIARYFSVRRNTISLFMKKHNLKTRNTKFKKGNNPPCKGKKGIHLSPKTEFKKGHKSWQTGLTKEIDKRLDYYRPTAFIKGQNKGIHRSEIIKNKISKTKSKKMKLYFKNNSKARENMRKIRFYAKISTKNTIPEIKTFTWLNNHNIKFEMHKTIKNICQPDAFVKPNICIFVDGDYWHCNPNKYKIKKVDKIQKYVIKKDKKQTRKLKKFRYKIIRIWECDINKNNFSNLKYIKLIQIIEKIKQFSSTLNFKNV